MNNYELKNYKILNDVFDVVPDPISGNPGKLSQKYQDNAISVINKFRKQCNIQNAYHKKEYDVPAQAAALLVAVNQKLDHNPINDGTWTHWTKDAAYGAGLSSLLIYQKVFPNAVDVYESILHFLGDTHVASLGHRLWIINPFIKQYSLGMAYSIVDDKNFKLIWGGAALSIEMFDRYTSVDVDYIAFPQNNCPYKIKWDPATELCFVPIANKNKYHENRDPLNYDFSQATVMMKTSSGKEVEVFNISDNTRESAIIMCALKWKVKELEYEVDYEVTIENIKIKGEIKSYKYNFKLTDKDDNTGFLLEDKIPNINNSIEKIAHSTTDKAKTILQNQIEENSTFTNGSADPIVAIMPFVNEATIKSMLSIIEKEITKEKLESIIYLKESKNEAETLINLLKNEEIVNKILKNEQVLNVFKTNQNLYTIINYLKKDKDSVKSSDIINNTSNSSKIVNETKSLVTNNIITETKSLVTNNIVNEPESSVKNKSAAVTNTKSSDKYKKDIKDIVKENVEKAIIKNNDLEEEPTSVTEKTTNNIINNKITVTLDTGKTVVDDKGNILKVTEDVETFDLYNGRNFLLDEYYNSFKVEENRVDNAAAKESVKSIASNAQIQQQYKIDPKNSNIKEQPVQKNTTAFSKAEQEYIQVTSTSITNEVIQNIKTKNLITNTTKLKETEEVIKLIVQTEIIKELEKTKTVEKKEEVEPTVSVDTQKENIRESKIGKPKNDIASSNGSTNTINREVTQPRPYIGDPGKFPLIGKKA